MVKNKSQHQIKLCPWAGGEKKLLSHKYLSRGQLNLKKLNSATEHLCKSF